MSETTLIPKNDRTSALIPFLDVCYERLKSIPVEYSHIPLTVVFGLWDNESTVSGSELDTAQKVLREAGLDGENLYKEFCERINQIFKEDQHLSICCGKIPLNLATAIDLFYLGSRLKTEDYLGTPLNDTQLSKLKESFENELYKEEYKRFALFHLFNLEIEDKVPLRINKWVIGEIPPQHIPIVIGETTPFSRIHLPEVGNYYLIYQDSEPPNNSYDWIIAKYEEARNIEGLLQYFKDSIVHIDYYTFYFQPHWVNTIWRMGHFYYGNIRRHTLKRKYKIHNEETGELTNYWHVYLKNHDKFKNIEKSKLGLDIQRAARHFSNYHSKYLKEEQFIDLVIALESLFTPGPQESNFRISQLASIFLSDDEEEEEVFEFFNKILQLRNKLFHGFYKLRDVVDERFITDEELGKFSSYIRKALLGYIVLYLRGYNSRQYINKKLLSAILNAKTREEFRREFNFDVFMNEQLSELVKT
ncbi:HEPN domain-containing protein [Desulfobacterota bacterium AH_259_B03_O07]|nr:HEPN domain-containing protein [Desulfobacterota bacterium AH_259_B03_O07]